MKTLNGKVVLLAAMADTSRGRMLHSSGQPRLLVRPGRGWLAYRGDPGQTGGQG